MGKKAIDWCKVDWSKQDVVLAAEFGCSRQAVNQFRKDSRYGNGRKADNPRVWRGPTARNLLEAIPTVAWALPQLAGVVGCTEGRAATILRAMGKQFKHRPKGGQVYRWDRFPANWRDLTDKNIAAIVGAKYEAVVAQWRARHGYVRQRTSPTPAAYCSC